MIDKNRINQSLTAIIREAGLYHRQMLEFNDVNSKVISLGDFIMADIDGDGIVGIEDVAVLVDGEVAEVVEVDGVNALVTVSRPIQSGQSVVVKFASSGVELDYVETVRGEALGEIIAGVPCAAAWSDDYIPLLGYIQRLLAAGMLLIRDYGFNEDIQGTSKDGYKKIALANKKMEALVNSVCGDQQSANAQGFAGRDDGDLFTPLPRVNSEEW